VLSDVKALRSALTPQGGANGPDIASACGLMAPTATADDNHTRLGSGQLASRIAPFEPTVKYSVTHLIPSSSLVLLEVTQVLNHQLIMPTSRVHRHRRLNKTMRPLI
jgi:hypothetical protein